MPGTSSTITAVTTGCGVTGSGSADAPLLAAPMAGQQAWPWPCVGADHSTLKCDPTTGELWTPPEHNTVAGNVLSEHFPAALPPRGVTGWAVVDPGANAFMNLAAGLLSTCRAYSWAVTWTLTADIAWTATAAFEIGYAYQVGTDPVQVRPLWGLLTAGTAASCRRTNASFHRAGNNVPAAVASTMTVWPAIRVISGQVTINSWQTDMLVNVNTRANA